MIEGDSYSERITYNEQRIAELKGRIYTDKLTVKSLEKENERCFEAMNNLTSVVDTHKDTKDKKILELTKTVQELKEKNETLINGRDDLKAEMECVIDNLNQEVADLKRKLLMSQEMSQDIILADNFHDANIFEDIRGEKV